MDNDINNIRNQITGIDKKIITLLQKRYSLSYEIGIIKIRQGRDIKDTGQEKKVLAEITNLPHDPIPNKDLIHLFTSIIKLSRKFQQSLKNNLSPKG